MLYVRKVRVFAASFLLIGMFSAVRLAAEDKATDLIPAKTLAVVRFKNPTELIDKGAGLVDVLQPGMGGQVRKFADGIGYLIDNPTLAGVSKDDAWWIALENDPERGDVSQPLFIVPLLKGHEEDLPKALGDSYQFVRKGAWGVYTKKKQTFEEVQKLLNGAGKSITAAIDEPSGKVFTEGDVSVFLNLGQFIADHRGDLTRAQDQIGKELNEGAERGPVTPGVNKKAAFQAITQMANSVIQCIQDTQSCVIAVRISKQGLLLEDLVRVTPDSASDKLLSGVPSAPLTSLSQLPGGHQIYFGAHFDLGKVLSLVASIMDEPADGKAKEAVELKRILEEFGKLKSGSVAGAIRTGSLKEGVLQSVSVAEIEPTEKARTLMHNMYKTLGAISTGPIKQVFKLEADAEKYGARTADVLTVSTTTENKELEERLNSTMHLMYGPDGAKTRIVYLKDRIIQAMGGGQKALADAIQGQEKSADPSVTSPLTKARGELPANANLILLLDLPTLIRNASILAIEGGLPLGIQATTFEQIKLKESYLAVSLGAEQRALRSRVFLPVDQVQGLFRLAISTGIMEKLGLFAGQ